MASKKLKNGLKKRSISVQKPGNGQKPAKNRSIAAHPSKGRSIHTENGVLPPTKIHKRLSFK
jgi:hypothetical protein